MEGGLRRKRGKEGVRKTTHGRQSLKRCVCEVCHHLRTVYRSTVREGRS